MRPPLVPYARTFGTGFPGTKVRSLSELPPTNIPSVQPFDSGSDDPLTYLDATHVAALCGFVLSGEFPGNVDPFAHDYLTDGSGHFYKNWTDTGGFANEVNPDSLFRTTKQTYADSSYGQSVLACTGTACTQTDTDTFPGGIRPGTESLTAVSMEGAEMVPDWRIVFELPPYAYLKLWVLHASYAPYSDTLINEILDPFEWFGSGVLPVDFSKPDGFGLSPPTPAAAPINIIVSAPVTFTRRGIPNSENAMSNQLSVLKYSFIPGYEPPPLDMAYLYDSGNYNSGFPLPVPVEWH